MSKGLQDTFGGGKQSVQGGTYGAYAMDLFMSLTPDVELRGGGKVRRILVQGSGSEDGVQIVYEEQYTGTGADWLQNVEKLREVLREQPDFVPQWNANKIGDREYHEFQLGGPTPRPTTREGRKARAEKTKQLQAIEKEERRVRKALEQAKRKMAVAERKLEGYTGQRSLSERIKELRASNKKRPTAKKAERLEALTKRRRNLQRQVRYYEKKYEATARKHFFPEREYAEFLKTKERTPGLINPLIDAELRAEFLDRRGLGFTVYERGRLDKTLVAPEAEAIRLERQTTDFSTITITSIFDAIYYQQR